MDMRTQHINNDRCNRERFIKTNIGFGNEVLSVVIDRNHSNGAEIHTVTDTGIIIVRNQRTKKLVTYLIARPNQIKYRYAMANKIAPQYLLDIAQEHEDLGYNYI